MIVQGGPDGEVFLPALYAGASADPNNQIRLGRTTEWRNEPGGPVRGFGQRMFLVGSEARAINELTTLMVISQ
jgi:type VI secretion system protein ImpE